MKTIVTRGLMALILLFSFACEPKQKLETNFLKVSDNDKAVNFQSVKSAKTIKVNSSNSNWTYTISKEAVSWLKVTKKDENLKLTAEENKLIDNRVATITIAVANLKEEIKITQLGTGGNVLVSPSEFTINEYSDEAQLSITSNTEYDVKLPSWITIKSDNIEEPEQGAKVHKYVLSIATNTSEGERRAEIEITTKSAPIITKNIPVIQRKGYRNNENTASIPEDIKLTISSGNASNFQNNENIEKSFDGDVRTLYHSSYNSTTFPITLTYNLANTPDVDYMVYTPRQDNNSNGNFKEVSIEYTTDGTNYTKVKEVNFQGRGSASRVYFDQRLSKVSAIRLTVKSGQGNNGTGFASAAEVAFYKVNDSDFDPKTIFTDASCSALKEGVTQEQIIAIKNPFFKNIARYLKEGTYPSDFRIQEYRAWRDPWYIRNHNRMQYPYSNLDNPTGIRVDLGEELIVLVGATHGKHIGIKIQDLDVPNGDGFGNAEHHTLYEGVNKIRAGHKGLIYLQYQDSEAENAPKIKVHFATGTVNGYFDSSKHKAEDWTKLLDAATGKYFDVIGKNAHLCFETADFKLHTHGKGKELIDTFDKLLDQTHKFDGTDTGDRKMTNRAYFQVMYKAYMYCTNFRTSYNQTTMGTLCSPEAMKRSNWGPAHEIGHSHQIAPSFMWIGLTECTVNMNSMNIQTAWNIPTRLQNESMGDSYRNRYGKAFNLAFVDKNTFCDLDVFCKLVSFWQLNLYFSKVKGNENFSVSYYDTFRNVERVSGKNDGEYQVDFTKTFSKLVRTDLTDFFEKWGFYRPINKRVEDYATRQLTVTADYANRITQEIKALGYDKLNECIEYISDNNWELFKKKQDVVKGTARLVGRKITCTGYQNVVAYEVRETANDNLIFVSNTDTFTLTRDFNSSTMKVYAIAYNRKKTEVTF